MKPTEKKNKHDECKSPWRCNPNVLRDSHFFHIACFLDINAKYLTYGFAMFLRFLRFISLFRSVSYSDFTATAMLLEGCLV